jgi:hypothetical protein
MHRYSTQVITLLRSRTFFVAIMALFVVESSWIALSASYPMAFDEDFHFGIIKLYAKQWSPFFAHQPAGGNVYGALTTDPSYLYHYLMSFPYRLVSLLTSSQMAQIITLRFIDIGMFSIGLILFRKLLLRTKAPPSLIHIAILFFILIPVVPLLAGQINYDDLLMPLVALSLLLAVEFKQQLQTENVMRGGRLLVLAALCMLASLVQFEFLPIFFAIGVYVLWNLWRFNRAKPHAVGNALSLNWHHTKPVYQIGSVLLFVVALGLFAKSYGTNLVIYHNPIPQCNQVMSIHDCSAYSPWLRNYQDSLNKSAVSTNPLIYTRHWFYAMFYNSFFSSSGGADTAAYYIHVAPLPIISITAIIVFTGGLLLLLRYGKGILHEYPLLGFLLYASITYCVVLWLWNYHDYTHLGAAVALNGRYLLPVILPILLLMALAYRKLLLNHGTLQLTLLATVLVLFIEGGGALTFIEASNAHWYWPNNGVVDGVNQVAQKVVKPLIYS